MKPVLQFFKLIRWQNLFFIALAQGLLFFAIAKPVLSPYHFFTRELQLLFYVLCFSSVLIAAAGYIINDYFDINIDIVNKPQKLVVDNGISRRWAIFFHFIFSLAGILMGFYIGLETGNWLIGCSHTGVALLLWIYSTTLKKKAVSGNVLIALLTAWSLLVVYFYVLLNTDFAVATEVHLEALQKFFRISLLYAAFAFQVTLIREMVKDIEDVEGDRRYGCKTMPIIWGIQVSKIVVTIFMIFLLSLLVLVLFYILQYRMWVPSLYNLLFLLIPSILTFRYFQLAQTVADFNKVSQWIKGIMLSGILSMLLFRIFA
jgi:4-hydroxybenzoate polyprenyltransferase